MTEFICEKREIKIINLKSPLDNIFRTIVKITFITMRIIAATTWPLTLVTDDPNTLSLQHFDGDYTDSSSYNRTFYSENRSTQYVDSSAFGQGVKLSSGSAAGVTIPGLSSYDSLSFDFRVYYADVSNLGIYFGDTNIFQRIPSYKSQTVSDIYSDDGNTFNLGRYCWLSVHPAP